MGATGVSYAFGPYVLNVDDRQLLRDGEEIPLTHKAFETLCALVARHGHMVSKRDLLHAVWPDSIVEENNLSQNISVLRKLLNVQGGEPYIVTVPKHGYRFNGRVTKPEVSSPPVGAAAPAEPLRTPQTH